LDKLGPEASLREYVVRPPKGYAEALRQQKEGFQLVVWRGEARPDRTAPALMVTLTTIPPGEKMTTPENYLVADLAQVRKRRPSLTHTRPERGRVNGLEFVRSRWEGDDPQFGRKMRGFTYAAVDGRTVITIASQDFEPHHEAALKLAEAAAQTFRKR
jgi:hypothetical protein